MALLGCVTEKPKPAPADPPISQQTQTLASAGAERAIPLRFYKMYSGGGGPWLPTDTVLYQRVRKGIDVANAVYRSAGVQFYLADFKRCESVVSPFYDEYADLRTPVSPTYPDGDREITWAVARNDLRCAYPNLPVAAPYQGAARESWWQRYIATAFGAPSEIPIFLHKYTNENRAFAEFPHQGAGVHLVAADANPSTLAHELGHSLGLPHTFGGVYTPASAGIDPSTGQPFQLADMWDLTYLPGDSDANPHRFFASRGEALDAGAATDGAALCMINRRSYDDAGGITDLCTVAGGPDYKVGCTVGTIGVNSVGRQEWHENPDIAMRGMGFQTSDGTYAANVMSYLYIYAADRVGLSDSQAQIVRKFLRYETVIDNEQGYLLNGQRGGRTQLGSDVQQQPNVQVKLDNDDLRDIVWWTPYTTSMGDEGRFTYRLSSTNYAVEATTNAFGQTGDQPMVADFTGDGISDFAIFRPGGGADGTAYDDTDGRWQWCLNMSCSLKNIQVIFGQRGDVPLPGLDFDANPATAELAVYRPSTGEFLWASAFNPTNVTSRVLGNPHAIPLPGLYDADEKTDLAVYDPVTAVFSLRLSTSCIYSSCWMYPSTVTFPNDLKGAVDGTGGTPAGSTVDRGSGVVVRGVVQHRDVGGGVYKPRLAAAVWAPWTGSWYIKWDPSNGTTPPGFCNWGANGDIPIGGLGSPAGSLSSTRSSRMAYFRSLDVSDGPGYVAQRDFQGRCVGQIYPTSLLANGRPKSMVFPVADMSGDGKPDLCVVDPQSKAGRCYRSNDDFATEITTTILTYGSHLSVIL